MQLYFRTRRKKLTSFGPGSFSFTLIAFDQARFPLSFEKSWSFEYLLLGDYAVGLHCVKSVRIRSYSAPYFPALGLNTERYVFSPNAGKYGPEQLQIQTLFRQCYSMVGKKVSLCIQFECGKLHTSITPNTDTFHAVLFYGRQKQHDDLLNQGTNRLHPAGNTMLR